VCGACANGCNIEIFHREGRLFRFQPRFNPEVNDFWMCDAGHTSWGALQGENRLFEVLVRADDSFAPTDATTAIATATARLQTLARAHGPGTIGVVVSARASNEEIFAARKLGAGLGATVVGMSWSPANAFADDFVIKADKNPNTQGLLRQGLTTDAASVEKLLAGVEAGTVRALVVVRSDLTRWLDAARVEQALERVEYLVVVDSEGTETAQCANVVLPIGTYPESDGTFTNHAGRVQRFHQAVASVGQARPGWQVLGDLVAAVSGTPVAKDAAGMFAALAAEGGAFAGLDYERLGEHGATAANASA
jgi:NADH-quinone oxidoreductase subunit G